MQSKIFLLEVLKTDWKVVCSGFFFKEPGKVLLSAVYELLDTLEITMLNLTFSAKVRGISGEYKPFWVEFLFD